MKKTHICSKFLWCPIIMILSLIILLSLPCENVLVPSNCGCQKKKPISRYDKLHSISKSLMVISLKFPYTFIDYSVSRKQPPNWWILLHYKPVLTILIFQGRVSNMQGSTQFFFVWQSQIDGTKTFSHSNDSRMIRLEIFMIGQHRNFETTWFFFFI